MRIRLVLVLTVLLVPRISAAQSAPVPEKPLPRIYVDANLIGYRAPLGDAKTFENYAVRSGEIATFKATYPEPSSPGLYPAYVGGGFMLTRMIGVGASYSRMSRDSVVKLSATVPDPAFYNALATDTGTTTSTLSRTESAVHVSAVFAPFRSARMEFRVMGGPSFFTLKGDMVSEVNYEQTFSDLEPRNRITVDGNATRSASGSAVGYHVGADYTYFVHRMVGVTGGVRYGRAIVPVDGEPLSNIRQEFLVGSSTVFFGLRFRLDLVK